MVSHKYSKRSILILLVLVSAFIYVGLLMISKFRALFYARNIIIIPSSNIDLNLIYSLPISLFSYLKFLVTILYCILVISALTLTLSFIFSAAAFILVMGNSQLNFSNLDATDSDLYFVLLATIIRAITPQMFSDLMFGPSLLNHEQSRIRCEQQFYVTSGSGFLIRKIITCLQFINSADNDRAEAYALSALHTSQGYSRTVTHQLWKLARLFSKPSNNVHFSIMRQPLSVEILIESAEWKRLAQNLTFKNSYLLHNTTALLQHSENMKPQSIFSEFVVLKQFVNLLDLYISKANCYKELESLELVVEKAKLSPLVHWYIVISITAAAIKRQVHSNTLDQWLSIEQLLFSKISLITFCNSQLSKSRAEQLKILRKIGLLSFSSVRKAQMADFTSSLKDANSALDFISRKKQLDYQTSKSFFDGRSRVNNAISDGYREAQCVDVLLEAADSIEKRLEFIFSNLALEGRWRVYVNTLLSLPKNKAPKHSVLNSSKNSSNLHRKSFSNGTDLNANVNQLFLNNTHKFFNPINTTKVSLENQSSSAFNSSLNINNASSKNTKITTKDSESILTPDYTNKEALKPTLEKYLRSQSISAPTKDQIFSFSDTSADSSNYSHLNTFFQNQSNLGPAPNDDQTSDYEYESEVEYNSGSEISYYSDDQIDSEYDNSNQLENNSSLGYERESNASFESDLNYQSSGCHSDFSHRSVSNQKELRDLINQKNSQKLDILNHLSLLRQNATNSAGSHTLPYISMYQQLSSTIVLDEL
ncbi:hypothetical protein AYI70_g3213 [Smittium culicis]|uniref:Uncharacterized protein n=1 Tax=Smittium culicis TaxID=133412 RepID=A0A1R1Y550_9FUNG|nr:hypothetical protein AYI70_g3213 [Smittium culicis]